MHAQEVLMEEKKPQSCIRIRKSLRIICFLGILLVENQVKSKSLVCCWNYQQSQLILQNIQIGIGKKFNSTQMFKDQFGVQMIVQQFLDIMYLKLQDKKISIILLLILETTKLLLVYHNAIKIMSFSTHSDIRGMIQLDHLQQYIIAFVHCEYHRMKNLVTKIFEKNLNQS
ncbi:unnamed protein product [Paramecium primaurelia]|uniref:Uncharacterized protein n=1 Tax=Paramecium primaurelia TaxID=5886 RepID=A0A8S1KEW0_PARPR|nr:unnamed protein product [Paramecium primaurelia]